MKNPTRLILAAGLTLIYSCLSLTYYVNLDPKFYIKDIFGCKIAFSFPVIYIALVAAYLFLYAFLMRKSVKKMIYPVMAIALILPIFYLAAELKAGITQLDTFGGGRAIYGAYANGYIFIVMSFFALMSGTLLRGLAEGRVGPLTAETGRKVHNMIFHMPVFIYFIATVHFLQSNDSGFLALPMLVIFLASFAFRGSQAALSALRKVFSYLIKKETLFLIGIFILAFFVRYLWARRLLGITGGNFIIASDDGPCYDKFARILAGGGRLSKESIFAVTGFSYWYFLAGIYKIFGAGNFRALCAVQSFTGAFVPVISYFMAKRVFGKPAVSAMAALFTALDMNLIFLSVVIGMEAIYIPLVMLALFLAVHFLSRGNINAGNAFITGCAFGLAYSARSPELLFFPVILGFIFYFFMRLKYSGKRIFTAVSSLVLGFFLLASVQYVTNYVIYGEKRIIPHAAVESFHVDTAEAGHTPENTVLGDMGFSPFEDLKGSLKVFARRPGEVSSLFVKGFFKRLTILYFLPNFGVFDPFVLVNPGSGYFFRFPAYLQFLAYLFFIAGLAAALLKKEKQAEIWVLAGFLMYISLRVAVFFVLNARYRGLLIPLFFMFLALGLDTFCKKVKNAYCKKGV